MEHSVQRAQAILWRALTLACCGLVLSRNNAFAQVTVAEAVLKELSLLTRSARAGHAVEMETFEEALHETRRLASTQSEFTAAERASFEAAEDDMGQLSSILKRYVRREADYLEARQAIGELVRDKKLVFVELEPPSEGYAAARTKFLSAQPAQIRVAATSTTREMPPSLLAQAKQQALADVQRTASDVAERAVASNPDITTAELRKRIVAAFSEEAKKPQYFLELPTGVLTVKKTVGGVETATKIPIGMIGGAAGAYTLCRHGGGGFDMCKRYLRERLLNIGGDGARSERAHRRSDAEPHGAAAKGRQDAAC